MRIFRTFFYLVVAVAAMAVAVSCAPGVPDEYIQPGEMEDILYDYQIAMAMANQGDMSQVDVREVAYKQAVLKKYGYSEKQFDSSLEYYMRHTDRLHDIYENISERLDDQAKDLGANGTNLTADYSQNGDTTNVWKGSRSMILMPEPGFNSYSFTVKVDTAFHVGDRLMMQLNSTYIIQEGTRNAAAVVAITLDNDSVISQVMRISSDSRQSLFVSGPPDRKIKAIKGYILFPPDNGVVPSTTVKILCLTDIQLLRIHAPKPGDSQSGGPQGPSSGMPGTMPMGPSPSSGPMSSGGPSPSSGQPPVNPAAPVTARPQGPQSR